MFKKIIALSISFCLIFEQSGFAQVAGGMHIPGYMANLMPPEVFRPVQLRAISFDAGAEKLSLFLDRGDTEPAPAADSRSTAAELYKYFQIGLRLPNNIFWVNLRPDSPQDIIDPYLEKTDVGRILLAADLQLKKDLALFTSPDRAEGKRYWDKLYAKAQSLYGQADMEIPTFTRPWIVPGEIIIRESKDGAYIYKAGLQVMLEQDYLKDSPFFSITDPKQKEMNAYSSELLRAEILPRLTREINSAKRYAALRQVYYSLVLAQWFKQKASRQTSAYAQAIDTKDLTGLAAQAPWNKDTYYNAYKTSFSQGEYNKEEQVSTSSGLIIRTYFSGGVALDGGSPAFAISADTGIDKFFARIEEAIRIDDNVNVQIVSPVQLATSISTNSRIPPNKILNFLVFGDRFRNLPPSPTVYDSSAPVDEKELNELLQEQVKFFAMQNNKDGGIGMMAEQLFSLLMQPEAGALLAYAALLGSMTVAILILRKLSGRVSLVQAGIILAVGGIVGTVVALGLAGRSFLDLLPILNLKLVFTLVGVTGTTFVKDDGITREEENMIKTIEDTIEANTVNKNSVSLTIEFLDRTGLNGRKTMILFPFARDGEVFIGYLKGGRKYAFILGALRPKEKLVIPPTCVGITSGVVAVKAESVPISATTAPAETEQAFAVKTVKQQIGEEIRMFVRFQGTDIFDFLNTLGKTEGPIALETIRAGINNILEDLNAPLLEKDPEFLTVRNNSVSLFGVEIGYMLSEGVKLHAEERLAASFLSRSREQSAVEEHLLADSTQRRIIEAIKQKYIDDILALRRLKQSPERMRHLLDALRSEWAQAGVTRIEIIDTLFAQLGMSDDVSPNETYPGETYIVSSYGSKVRETFLDAPINEIAMLAESAARGIVIPVIGEDNLPLVLSAMETYLMQRGGISETEITDAARRAESKLKNYEKLVKTIEQFSASTYDDKIRANALELITSLRDMAEAGGEYLLVLLQFLDIAEKVDPEMILLSASKVMHTEKYDFGRFFNTEFGKQVGEELFNMFSLLKRQGHSEGTIRSMINFMHDALYEPASSDPEEAGLKDGGDIKVTIDDMDELLFGESLALFRKSYNDPKYQFGKEGIPFYLIQAVVERCRKQNRTTADVFWNQPERDRYIYQSIMHFIREQKIRQIKINRPQVNSGNSGQAQDGGTTGGIDFRALPLNTQPGMNPAMIQPAIDLKALQALAQSSKIKDLDREWNRIEKQIAGKTMPYEKMKEFIAVCCERKASRDQLNKVVRCLNNILRLEEACAVQTSSQMKELLVIVEEVKT